jgi:hypothetical protein
MRLIKTWITFLYRVVADHIRTLTVSLSDGGRPGAIFIKLFVTVI